MPDKQKKFIPILDDGDDAPQKPPTPQPPKPKPQPPQQPPVVPPVVEKPVSPSNDTKPVAPSKPPKIKRKQPLTLQDEKIIKITTPLSPDYPPRYFKPY